MGISGRKPNLLIMDEEIKNMTGAMEKTLEHFREEIASLRTGRATPSLVDGISVEYYGQNMKINQVANISVLPPSTIVIQPWDKNALEPIQKAILQSPLGIAPIADKDAIRLALPALNQERREALVKILNQKTEEARIALRREREAAIQRAQKMKEDGEIREDDFFRAKDRIQKTVDEFNNEKIKDLRDKKEKEILEV